MRGISINKVLINTKADMTGVPLSSYKIMEHNDFGFVTVTSRNGEKISLAMNSDKENYIVSSTYEIFQVDITKILPEFLYLWFCRPEFDRYARFNSWGSARETFDFEDMKRVKIPLLPLEQQQAIVNIYNCAKEAQNISQKSEEQINQLCPALMRHVIGEA